MHAFRSIGKAIGPEMSDQTKMRSPAKIQHRIATIRAEMEVHREAIRKLDAQDLSERERDELNTLEFMVCLMEVDIEALEWVLEDKS